jgi:hypothetical protein
LSLLAAIFVGRLVIWLAQTNGLTKRFWSLHPLLAELAECDLCLGCWLMPLVVWLMDVNLLAPIYVPVVSEVLTGWILSFGLHLGRLGWQTKFGVTILSGE